MIYAVIDTNVIVSAFITHHQDASTVKVLHHVINSDIKPLYDKDILNEYRQVLSRKKFKIEKTVIDSLINMFIEQGLQMSRTPFAESMPDESDRVFYEISLSKEDSFLVTGNLKHYPVSPKVVSPNEFVNMFGL